MSVRRVGVEGTGHSVMSIPKLFPYRWKYMIQCGSVVTRFIFFKILTADIGWIAQEGEPWGTYCEFEVWPVFYIDNCAAAPNHSVYALCKWETALQCNAVSHWLWRIRRMIPGAVSNIVLNLTALRIGPNDAGKGDCAVKWTIWIVNAVATN